MLEILIGLPASGKSSYCKDKLKENKDIEIVSSDAIREEVFGDVNDQSHNGEVFNIVFKRVREAILNNRDVILDATNLSRKRRINFIKEMPKTFIRAIVFAVPFEICCERNAHRNRVVPQTVMERMYKQFEAPSYAEGFDDIKIIKNSISDESIEDILAENINCSHDNPHHRLSCGEHCLAAEEYIKELWYNSSIEDEDDYIILRNAARYHDVSKYKCKTFYNAKGEKSKVAHYYGHENCSAYDYLAYYNSCFNEQSMLLVANLINNHMVFFAGDMVVNRKRLLYGEKFFKLLSILHEADLASH